MTLADQLRREIRNAIRKSGESQNEFAKRSGVPQPTLNRFLNGADASIAVADKLARAIGLRFAKAKVRRKYVGAKVEIITAQGTSR